MASRSGLWRAVVERVGWLRVIVATLGAALTGVWLAFSAWSSRATVDQVAAVSQSVDRLGVRVAEVGERVQSVAATQARHDQQIDRIYTLERDMAVQRAVLERIEANVVGVARSVGARPSRR